jgi:hypothetical protein
MCCQETLFVYIGCLLFRSVSNYLWFVSFEPEIVGKLKIVLSDN